jgi:sodium-dependent dicarboxylate transporter 2/3/5
MSDRTPDIHERLSPAEERFERYRRLLGLILTPLAFFVTYSLTSGLSPQGRRLSAILVSVAVLWITELIPLPVTALLGALLCIILGVAPIKTVLRPFADPIVFVFLGSFILARAMTLHRLDRRIALTFLSIRWIGTHPARVLCGIGAVTALISMWVSNTATTAMMLPIALGILSALHAVRVSHGVASGPLDARRWPYATAMMLMVAYAASVGGIATPVGSPPNLIAIRGLREAGVHISFFKWMALMTPMLLLMSAVLFALLYALHPDRSRPPAAGPPPDISAFIRSQRDLLGPWTRAQINTLIAFSIAVVLWVLPGVLSVPAFGAQPAVDWLNARLPEPAVALLAASLLFVLPVNLRLPEFTLTWRDAAQIDWGTILLFGGGLALGELMTSTGVAAALGKSITSAIGPTPLWTLTAVAILLSIFLSETTSNTTAALMMTPLMITVARSAGVSPIPPALGACLGASFGFMLPVSTPPNAIAYGSGLVPITRMARAGLVFDILGFFIIWAGLRLLCPPLGLL